MCLFCIIVTFIMEPRLSCQGKNNAGHFGPAMFGFCANGFAFNLAIWMVFNLFEIKLHALVPRIQLGL